MKVLDPITWTEIDVSNPVFVDSKVLFLCNLVGLRDARKYVDSFQQFVSSGGKENRETAELINTVNTIPISSAECQRGY